MTSRGGGVLGLFPSLSETGGVQASGRVAWTGIRRALESASRDALLFSYGGGAPTDGDGPAVHCASKLGAAFAALRTRWPVGLVLVWHLNLLKLLPFFRIGDARAVAVLHGIEGWKPLDWLTGALVERVDLLLSDSDHTWRRFLGANPRYAHRPHRTVHLGISTPFRGDVPAPGHPPVALMVGRLLRSEDYKGHREMIGAWPRVLERMPDAELWIAGDGDLRDALERGVRRQGLEERIRFWGSVSEARKHELLARCRCLALPSKNEGFGLVYLEAMRLGRPCLVSTLDAGCEVVNPPEAGLSVDVEKPEVLAAAIGRLLAPGPEWAAWSRQARRRYEEHFTAAHFHERLVAALTPFL